MGNRLQVVALGAFFGLVACGGDAKSVAGSTGVGGASAANGGASGGVTQVGGRTGASGSASTSAGASTGGTSSATAGDAGASFGGGGASSSSGAGSGGAGGACISHERPTPGAKSKSFSEIVTSIAGVYRIDAQYQGKASCGSMCSLGAIGAANTNETPYFVIRPSTEFSDVHLRLCQTIAACQGTADAYGSIGTFDTVTSDSILSYEQVSVENPEQQMCTGGPIETWLIIGDSGQLRIDEQDVSVTFPATLDAQTQLYSCNSGDAKTAAVGKPCTEVFVIDATRVADLAN